MKFLFLVALVSLIALVLPCNLEHGWKGIKVLESTRVEVEKILGKPVEDRDGVVRYRTEDANFRFLYAEKPCSAPDTLLGGYDVKEGTVLQYEVQPRNLLKLSDIERDEMNYERAKDIHVATFVNYYSKIYGIRLATRLAEPEGVEFVRTIDFERTAEQNAKYSCKK